MSRRFVLVLLVISVISSLSVSINSVSAAGIGSYIVKLNPCDSSGTIKTTFGPAEFVYVVGSGYLPLEEMTIRVIPNGTGYLGANSVCNVLTKSDGSGKLGPVKLSVFTPGEYNIWADRDSDGFLDRGWPKPEPLASYGCGRGFLVVPEFLFGTIMGLAGSFGAIAVFYASKRKRKIV